MWQKDQTPTLNEATSLTDGNASVSVSCESRFASTEVTVDLLVKQALGVWMAVLEQFTGLNCKRKVVTEDY